MAPPIAVDGPSNVVYESQMHYSKARSRVTTTSSRGGAAHNGGPPYSAHLTPTKKSPLHVPPAAVTPGTEEESFDDAGAAYDNNYNSNPNDDSGAAVYSAQEDSSIGGDDDNSELAIADGGQVEEVSSGMLGIRARNDNTSKASQQRGGGSINDTGVRDPGISPTGYQVPGGRGFAPAPSSSSPNASRNSTASVKSGVPGVASPVPPSNAIHSNAGQGNNGITTNGPPLTAIKTKPKKKKKSSRSKKYESAEAEMARYYAEEEPFDCAPGIGGAGIGGAADPPASASASDAAADPPVTVGGPPIRQPRAVRPAVPATAVASTSPTPTGTAAAQSKPYERMYYSEAEDSTAAGGATAPPRLATASHSTTGRTTGHGHGHGITNPFDDSFDTAAASNVPTSSANGAAAATTKAEGKAALAAKANTTAALPPTPRSPSAIQRVKARHQQQQQKQQQKQQSRSNNIANAASSSSIGSNRSNRPQGRAEKSPTPTNANLSVPRAPSNASTHVGPLDELTIMSTGTGESWKRAEEEFAAAEKAAAKRLGGTASWDADPTLEAEESFEGKVQLQPAAAAAAGKRQGILKTSSSRATGRAGRLHPWDKKSSSLSSPDDRDQGDNDTLFNFEDEASKNQRAELKASRERKKEERARALAGNGGIKKSMSHDSALSGGGGGSKRRGSRRGKSYDEDDESTAPGLTLQDRTQEAWKRKKGGNGSSHNDVARSRSAPRPGRSGSVAFTKDTIHHFENDDESTVVTKDDSLVSARYRRGRRGDEAYSDDDTYYSRRTTATDYSNMPKSYESEVEDIVKDFLFIGRGAKSAPGSKRHHSRYNRYKDEESTYTGGDDGTVGTYDGTFATYDESTYVTRGTYDESTYVTRDTSVGSETLESEDNTVIKDESTARKNANKRSSRVDDDDQTQISVDVVDKSSPCGQENCEDNPLSVVWEFMEGGIGAMSQALGLSEAKPQTKASASRSSGKQHPSVSKAPSADEGSALSGLMDYANEMVFGQNSSEIGNSADPDGLTSRTVTPTQSIDNSVDKEAGLVELSLCAAKAKHMTAGVPFDDTAEIDVVNEIKFNVITTALPLGLLFQENSAGCWVAKVFTKGNAANAAVGKGVEIGDQLAAVNGNSTIKLTVDEVCDMISSSPNPDEIELTFLRYIGPLHSKKSPGNPLRRSTGSGLFGNARALRTRSPSPVRKSAEVTPQQQPEKQKQKKKFLGRSKSSKKTSAPAPVPAISESTSSDFLGDDTIKATNEAASKDKKKKKIPFFGRKKKGHA